MNLMLFDLLIYLFNIQSAEELTDSTFIADDCANAYHKLIFQEFLSISYGLNKPQVIMV